MNHLNNFENKIASLYIYIFIFHISNTILLTSDLHIRACSERESEKEREPCFLIISVLKQAK